MMRLLQVRVVFFFFSSRRRHTRCREVSWARRCVQETGTALIWTLVRSLSGMTTYVNFKSTGAKKSCVAVFAFERFFIIMTANMILQMTLSCKIFVTSIYRTCVWLFPSVNPDMRFQVPFFCKRFITARVWTLKRLLPSMCTVSYTHLTLPTILLVQISVVAVSLKKKNSTEKHTDTGECRTYTQYESYTTSPTHLHLD
eukprot:TRINITY_DN57673_c0_g1_i1.p1 TRINITY_DN57673_c0_g1~~TRINITY_DN57673_c0_g1_i1.p1  ORF type:complete len:199 (+),score=29.05 TRINITY_DN57673_c0_g1_i1:16-612(+)